MRSWLRRLTARLAGTDALPESFDATLADDEQVLAVGRGQDGDVVATNRGVWVPEPDGVRRVGWHLVSKATWNDGLLRVVEAEETGTAGSAVLLRDRPDRRFRLAEPGRLPEVVHARVTGSIRSSHHRELPGGGAWFVQRRVPGRDGVLLQVRPDPGTDADALAGYAADVAEQLGQARRSGDE